MDSESTYIDHELQSFSQDTYETEIPLSDSGKETDNSQSNSTSQKGILNNSDTTVKLLGGKLIPENVEENLEWNHKFQEIIDALPEEFDLDNVSAHKGFYVELIRLTKDFVHLAEMYGKIIISEKELPLSQKTIHPIDEEQTKYVKRGILFKFRFYNGTQKGCNELISKALNHEFKGLLAFRNATGMKEIHFPLMALIDYRGHRIIATALLPIDQSTLKYGSFDEINFVKKDDKAISLIEEVCESLNLKEHKVGGEDGVYFMGPGSIEVHKGFDGKYYAFQFAKAMPPEYGSNLSELELSAFRLRPEFVRKYDVPLSSDALTEVGEHDHIIHDDEVKKATKYLKTNVIREFTERFEAYLHQDASQYMIGLAGLHSSLQQNAYKKAQTILINEMHREGINLRYMGKIRKEAKSKELKRVILVEMIARVLKNTLRRKWRNLVKKNPECGEESYKHVTAKFLNRALGESNESFIYWQFYVKPAIVAKFADGLSHKELSIEAELRETELLKNILLRVLEMCCIVISAPLHERISKDSSWLKQPEPIRALDIVNINSKIKTLNTIPFVEGLLLLESIKYLKTVKDKSWILKACLQKFNESLLVFPGGMIENLAVSKVLYKRAKLGILKLGKSIRLLEMAQHNLEYLRSTWEEEPSSIYLYAKTLFELGRLKNNTSLLKKSIAQFELYMSTGDTRPYFRCALAYVLLYHLEGKNMSHLETAYILLKRVVDSDLNKSSVLYEYAKLLSKLDLDDPASFAECDDAFAKAYASSPNDPSILYNWGVFYLRRAKKYNDPEFLLIASQKYKLAMNIAPKMDQYWSMHKLTDSLRKYYETYPLSDQTKATIKSLITYFSNSVNRCQSKFAIPHNKIIDYSRLRLIKPIVDSSVCYIFQAKYKKDDENEIDVVARILNRDLANEIDVAAFSNTVSIFLQLGPHPNIIEFLGKCYHRDSEMIIRAYCKEGNICNFFSKNYVNIVPWKKVIEIAIGVANGLAYIHSKGIIHNFITANNIQLEIDEENDKIVPKITNFSVSISITTQRISTDRDLEYFEEEIAHLSPETFSKGEFSFKSDIYSFGILLWELGYCGRAKPFESLTIKKIKEYVIKGGRLIVPERWPEQYKEIINQCFSHDPDTRPSIKNIIPKLQALLDDENLKDDTYFPPAKVRIKKRTRLNSTGSNRSTTSLDDSDGSSKKSEENYV